MLIQCQIFSQEKKIEDIFQECFYRKIGNKSIEYRKHLEGFENYLIKEEFMIDNSPKEYFKLLKMVTKKGVIKKRPKYSLDSLTYITKGKDLKMYSSKCFITINKHKDFNKFRNKVISFEKDFKSLLEKSKIITLPSITFEDLELEYYKHFTLYMIDLWFEISYDLNLNRL